MTAVAPMTPATQNATGSTPFAWTPLDDRAVNTIRGLAIDAVEKANSGHPGMPMGAATMAWVLWSRHLRHDPTEPAWADRDRFVLSAGHGSMLLYALLHLTGYDLPLEELKRFRQWGSRAPGHPEYGHTVGVETTTGPLGQGFGNAVGMALAERWLATRFASGAHRPIEHSTYVIAGDGDLMEGIASEAASFAGHQGLGRLIVLYDSNAISIDGSTDLAFTEDVGARFEAYRWHVQHVDGHDPAAVDAALRAAKAETNRPSLIVARTVIGFGSPGKQGTAAAHGAALGKKELDLAKAAFGLPADTPFYIADDVKAYMGESKTRGAALRAEWDAKIMALRAADEKTASGLDSALAGEMGLGWVDAIPTFEAGKSMATRKASSAVVNALAPKLPGLVGGSADLSESNLTVLHGQPDLQPTRGDGRNVHYGVREHAMGAIMNGMALHGGVRPYGGTFLIFSDYMRPSIRLAALMGLPVIFVFTHDSIGQGEDGPTHQPVEQLMSLRMIPNLRVLRPADATETAVSWRMALERLGGPTALVLTRQDIPVLDRGPQSSLTPADGVRHGAYVLSDAPRSETAPVPAAVLVGTGSEVQPCLDAQQLLAADGIAVRVVSMPSMELFAEQPAGYRESVFPPGIPVVSVEAGVSHGWERYTGTEGLSIGLNHFGASAPGPVLMKEFGFTGDQVAARVKALLGAPGPSTSARAPATAAH